MEDSAAVNPMSLDDAVTDVPLGLTGLDLVAANPASVICRDPCMASATRSTVSVLVGLAHMAPSVIAASRGTGAFPTAGSAYATATRRSVTRGQGPV